jgi:hypothetical protein
MSKSLLLACLLLVLNTAQVARAITYTTVPIEVISGQTVDISLFFNTESVTDASAIGGTLNTSGTTTFDAVVAGADNLNLGVCARTIAPPWLGWACGPPEGSLQSNNSFEVLVFTITAGAVGDDIILLFGSYLETTTYTEPDVDNVGATLVAVIVPESSVAPLLALGLAGLAVMRRRAS